MKAHTYKLSQAAADSVQLPDYLRQAELPSRFYRVHPNTNVTVIVFRALLCELSAPPLLCSLRLLTTIDNLAKSPGSLWALASRGGRPPAGAHVGEFFGGSFDTLPSQFHSVGTDGGVHEQLEDALDVDA
ncbi:hypothetical protein N7472_001644 [Penicillium cf. griseofulvum]|uniref:Uncharacterized protein n=1 Tax=Penicillium cf. griseofulvum TaxID=2972120 RepID=A0A9W9MPM9_9EURO|nr:hypothetical protein N7472_001644 [Penicillium cf. griseofulvum]